MKYDLRPATEDDYQFLYDLHAATIREAVAAMWGWDEAFQQERFRRKFDPAGQWIVVVDGADVGVLRLEEQDEQLFLALIEVAPAHQGQGLGTALIKDVLADAHGRGKPVALTVLKTNPRARRLYERLGFAVTEEKEDRDVMVAHLPR